MHKISFYFVSKIEKSLINNLDKNIHIIYRNYSKKYNIDEIVKLKKICKVTKRKLFLANDLKLAINLNLDGVYIPSFNKKPTHKIFNNKKFSLLGSAHNLKEISEKRRQKINLLFISPLFKIKKTNYFLGPIKFNILTKHFNKKTIVLGGINERNIKMLNIINCYGFGSISYIEKHKFNGKRNN